MFGGKLGSCFKIDIRDPETGRIIKELPPKALLEQCDATQAGYNAMPGGGGYGVPWERDVEKVREDVVEGYVSVRGAREDYGVVIDPETFEVDEDATEILRSKMKGG